MSRTKFVTALSISILTTLAALPMWAGLSEHRWTMTFSAGAPIGGSVFDVRPGYSDNYYDQELIDTSGQTGPALLLYRENGPGWSGETGFYYWVYGTPIEPGESFTWPNIYLWSQGYTPPDNIIEVSGGPTPPGGPPPAPGFRGKFFLDHVPASLHWEGPYEFDIDPHHASFLYLPVPVFTGVPDPQHDDFTIMHFTIYGPEVPEPSSLPALAAGLAGLGGIAIRRRR